MHRFLISLVLFFPLCALGSRAQSGISLPGRPGGGVGTTAPGTTMLEGDSFQLRGPNPWLDVTALGASGSNDTETGSINSGTTTLTLGSPLLGVANGQGLTVYHAGTNSEPSTPVGITAFPIGPLSAVAINAGGSGYKVGDTLGIQVEGMQQVDASSAASVNGSSIATITLTENPRTLGFTSGSTVTVAGFTGNDAYFNGRFTLTAVTVTSVSYNLIHAAAVATTQGVVIQNGANWGIDALLTVSSVSRGGAITGVKITKAGHDYTNFTGAASFAITGGGGVYGCALQIGVASGYCGSGATFNLTASTGSTTITYQVVAVDNKCGISAPSSTLSVTNANASLAAAFPEVGVELIGSNVSTTLANAVYPGAADFPSLNLAAIAVYKNGAYAGEARPNWPAASTWRFVDTGVKPSRPGCIPATVPSRAMAQDLITTIASGAGTTRVTTAAAAGTSVTHATVRPDDGVAIQAAITSAINGGGNTVYLPAGNKNPVAANVGGATYNFHSLSYATGLGLVNYVSVKLKVGGLLAPLFTVAPANYGIHFEGEEGQEQPGFTFPTASVYAVANPVFDLIANFESINGIALSNTAPGDCIELNGFNQDVGHFQCITAGAGANIYIAGGFNQKIHDSFLSNNTRMPTIDGLGFQSAGQVTLDSDISDGPVICGASVSNYPDAGGCGTWNVFNFYEENSASNESDFTLYTDHANAQGNIRIESWANADANNPQYLFDKQGRFAGGPFISHRISGVNIPFQLASESPTFAFLDGGSFDCGQSQLLTVNSLQCNTDNINAGGFRSYLPIVGGATGGNVYISTVVNDSVQDQFGNYGTIYCKSGGGGTTITIPNPSAIHTGEEYRIVTDGATNCSITAPIGGIDGIKAGHPFTVPASAGAGAYATVKDMGTFYTVIDSSYNVTKPLFTKQSITGATYVTSTKCAANGTATNPSVVSCYAAAAGMFSCSTKASTGTCQVNTTAVTADSQIEIIQTQADGGVGQLNVTCNTANVLNTGKPLLLSKSAGSNFVINLGTVTTNPACFEYVIVN